VKRAARIACAVWIALAGSAAFAGSAPPIPNALLVVDQNNQRVLRAELASGVVSVFSPPAGAQTNLLTSARGIGVGPDGTIVVTNYVENTLVEIDPATGAQFPVADFFSGDPPAIGLGPLDVAVNPRAPAPGFLPTLGVASQGALHQVVRSAFAATGSLLATYPSPYDTSLGNFLVARDPGTADPIDYYVATGGTPAILRYDGASDTFVPYRDYGSVDSIRGLAAPESGPYELVVSYLGAPCPSYDNGVALIGASGTSGISGGSYDCPGPVAFDSATGTLYTADASANPQAIVALDTDLLPGAPTAPFATLPSGAIASDMAVAAVPEPSAAALAALVVFMLFALRAAPGRSALSGIAACAALAVCTPADAVQLRAGDLLVTDAVNARVLHVDPETGIVTPFSPRTTSGPNLLFAPAGIAIDPDGAIFVVDSFADRIVRIDPVTGAQSVVHDFSAQLGDFGPSDVGTAPQGIDVEDSVTGLDRRDLFVASADGLYRVSRSSDATFTAPLSNAADVLLGTDVSVQENLGEPYSLWVVANGVLVRWYFENGATQALTESDARNVRGVEYALDTPLFTRNVCYAATSLNGLFVYEGSFGGTQLEGDGFAACLGRPLAAASPTLLYGTYGDADVVALVPEIGGYASEIVATLPEADVPPVAADLAVSPVTFPAPEPDSAAMGAVGALALAARRRSQ
jgi:sugar lactone lactonase YvrE